MAILASTLALLSAASLVAAHGHPIYIAVDGKSYKGWDLGIGGDKLTVGWTGVPDDGPVSTSQYGTSDIICHNGATPALGHAVVEAGKSVFIQYDLDQDELGQIWPVEHKGPIIDMLAPCPSTGCSTVDKESLEFFAIAKAGLIDDSDVSSGGHWPTDVLREQDNGWLVVVPPTIAPGFYVLRHEIIALHNAPDTDGGAQNYPFCFNLEVTGSGTEKPQGAKPTSFYSTADPGIDVSIWSPLGKYVVPGPALMDGVKPVVQSVMQVTGEGVILQGSDRAQEGGSGPAPSPAKSSRATAAPTASKTASVSVPRPTSGGRDSDGKDAQGDDKSGESGDNSDGDDEEEEKSEDDEDNHGSGRNRNGNGRNRYGKNFKNDSVAVATAVAHTTRFITVTTTVGASATEGAWRRLGRRRERHAGHRKL